jgi:hypothetical protein
MLRKKVNRKTKNKARMNIHTIVTVPAEEDLITETTKPFYNHCSCIRMAFKIIQPWSSINIFVPVENIVG